MTESLAEIFARASRLPAGDQDALAAWLPPGRGVAEELESEELDEDRSERGAAASHCALHPMPVASSQPARQAALKGGAGSRRRRRTDLTEERWGRRFARSRDDLGRLADEAIEEHAAGGSMVRDGG